MALFATPAHLAAPALAAAPSRDEPDVDPPLRETPRGVLDRLTFNSAIEALADWAPVSAGASAAPELDSIRIAAEAKGQRLLRDLLAMAATAEASDWTGAKSAHAIREAAVGASRPLREALVLGAIELSQLAPIEGQQRHHLLLAARLAESLAHVPNIPGFAEPVDASVPLGEAEDWERVIARIYDQVSASSGRANLAVQRGAARMEGLKPGALAPRFVARDTAGNEVRSTDFEGKIVLYRFWSDRSPASIAAHHRDLELLRRFWDTPFELVGISADQDRKVHLALLADDRLGGTQVYDGPIGTELVDALARAGNSSRTTPTSSTAAWNFPMIGSSILVDSKGVVRASNLHGMALAEAIERLVGEHRIRLRELRLTGQTGN